MFIETSTNENRLKDYKKKYKTCKVIEWVDLDAPQNAEMYVGDDVFAKISEVEKKGIYDPLQDWDKWW